MNFKDMPLSVQAKATEIGLRFIESMQVELMKPEADKLEFKEATMESLERLRTDIAAALTEAAKPNKDQALLWDAAVEAFGPEPFKELDSRGNCDCGSGFNGLIVAIRSRMEKP